MKISILLGRGIEGCGPTQSSRQIQILHTDTMIFATNDKKWPRRSGIDLNAVEFSCSDEFECNSIIQNINQNFDVCIIYSIPSINHPEMCQSNFIRILKEIKIRKCLINVDHAAQSIARNANIVEVCNSCDILLTHSFNNAFSKLVKSMNVITPLSTMNIGFDFNAHREKYWKPIDSQQSNIIRWIGRNANWKGTGIMVDFHQECLMKNEFITVMEGLEASISWRNVLYRKDGSRRKVKNYFRPEKEFGEVDTFNNSFHGTEELNQGAYLYPPYIHTECMERMSRSAFGAELYHLSPEIYGNNIENCHAEVIASGAVPIFHKHFCDNVIHRTQGLPITQCVNTGTIVVDHTPKTWSTAIETIIRLKNDPIERNEYREKAFEFWKQHADLTPIIDETLKVIFDSSRSKKWQNKSLF